MSLARPPNVSSLVTPAVNDEDQHSVVSEVFDANTNSNESENGSSGATTNPSSPEPTQSLDVDQPHQAAVLAEDPFDSEASRALFEAIDQFQSCGTGNFDAATPQLVVVGSQSVGKSSLLQSLTDVPFPVGTGCCTRFATRIVSSRTAPGTPNQVEISITPPDFDMEQFGYAQDDSYKEYTWKGSSITVEEFEEIVDLVSTSYMGINPGLGEDNKNFAVEVLKVKITGPNRSHFSILDLPGIFRYNHNARECEMIGVRDMVTQYMAQPEHIVICVADACVDLANQDIFTLAAQHVDRSRLIGVYTKCDRSSTSEEVVSVVNGTDENSQAHDHEWFVVRNKTRDEHKDPQFSQLEAETNLFNKKPWNSIPNTRRGSSMLKKYLARLLCDKIRDSFPGLFERLTASLRQAEERQIELGEPRDTYEKRRAYLVGIAERYQKQATEAIERPWLLKTASCQARTIIRAANEKFSKEMREEGHVYEFQDHSITQEECIARLKAVLFPFPDEDDEEDGDDEDANDEAGEPCLFGVIRREVAVCSSTQLPGIVHPDVVPRLYKLQSEKWQHMAGMHMKKVAITVCDASRKILVDVCGPSGETSPVYTEILHMLNQVHLVHLAEIAERLQAYCDGEQSKILQTTDPAFVRKHQLLRSLRIAKGIRRARQKLDENRGIMSVEQLGSLVCNECHFSSTNNTVAEVHDTLKVYYEVSLNAFIRHITNDIVEDFVMDSRNPLRQFSAAYIYSLPEAEVNRLGAESSEVSKEREKLGKRIETLNSVWEAGQLAMAKAAAVA